MMDDDVSSQSGFVLLMLRCVMMNGTVSKSRVADAQVFLWLVDSRGLTPDGTLLWTGKAAGLCGIQSDSCQVGALAMWSLAR